MSVQQWEQCTNRFHFIPPSILQRNHYRKLRPTACSHCCVSQDGGTSGQDGGTSDPDFRSVTRRSNVDPRGGMTRRKRIFQRNFSFDVCRFHSPYCNFRFAFTMYSVNKPFYKSVLYTEALSFYTLTYCSNMYSSLYIHKISHICKRTETWTAFSLQNKMCQGQGRKG